MKNLFFIIVLFCACQKAPVLTPTPSSPSYRYDSVMPVQWVYDSTKNYQFVANPQWGFSINYPTANYTMWVTKSSVWVSLPTTNFYWAGDSIWQSLGAIYYKRGPSHSPPVWLGVKIYHQ